MQLKMYSKYRLSYLFSQHLIDAAAVAVAWLIAFQLRYHVFAGRGIPEHEAFFLRLTPVIIATSIIFYNINHLYETHRYASWYKETFEILLANVQSLATFVVILYFIAPARFSRLTILLYLPLTQVTMVAARLVSRFLIRYSRRKGINLRYTVLAGSGGSMRAYVESLRSLPDIGIVIRGWIDSDGASSTYNIPEIPFEQAVDYLKQVSPNTIVIGYDNHKAERVDELLEGCYNSTSSILILPALSHSIIGCAVEEFEGIPIVRLNNPRMCTWELMLKRLIDIVGAVVGLTLCAPLFALIGILIKLGSKGPVFFLHERMNMGAERFRMVKFRTMLVTEGPNDENLWTTKDDPRRTKIGSFLRKVSLDEFPQLWNVLKGEMSLVGPRPERPYYVEQFCKKIPAYMLRLKVKSGMTGWAQVNGWRGDTSIEKRVTYDLYYIKNWSLWFDIQILVLTLIRGFVNKNAY
jgi:Undecaprenyl-phosphate glucose phosphotransferase